MEPHPKGAPPPGAPEIERSASVLDVSVVRGLDPAALRTVLPGFLASFVADPERAARNRERVGPLVAAWDDETCRSVVTLLSTLGQEHRLYPAHPACRALARAWNRDVVLDPVVEGAEHLAEARRRGPTLVVCNHLSYFDTTATDAILAWGGFAEEADRIVAAAGPKVYEDLFRLVAAASLHTLPVPQSSSFAHTARIPARELARKANESLESAAALLVEGYVLLLYPEGSRSRTGRLGPFLRGTWRYLSCVPDLAVVPMAIHGTEAVMAVGDPKLRPAPVGLKVGAARVVGRDGPPRAVLESLHGDLACLLPEQLRPAPDDPATA